MKFSFEWLKSLLDFKINPQEIGELLTLNLAETDLIKRGNRVVLDIDLLPDRIGDCGSHLGIAKEIALLKEKKFEWPQAKVKEKPKKAKDYLEVKIKTKNCQRYVARVMFNVKVKESPLWLKKRLEDCGLRPINNIVDASNYIMLLTGQPLHVFDFDKIDPENTKKKIIVRQANKNEKITTLEEKEYLLSEEIMVIASSKEALAIAGIKGGKKAEIDKNTKNIVLESANFEAFSIRKASQKLNLKTDASYRFEHKVPIELSSYAIDLLANLIQDLAGGEILKGKIDVLLKTNQKAKRIILVEWEKINKFLGIPIKKERVINILKGLDFKILKNTEKCLLLEQPFLRNFNYQEEVIGEVARIIGFNNFPSLPPEESLKLPLENENWIFKNNLKNWLKGFSLEEVYNYSFISKKEGSLWSSKERELIELQNPLSENFYYLRPTLLFNFLKNTKDNFRFFDKVRLFEVGKIYYKNKDKNKDKNKSLKDSPFLEKEVFSGTLALKEKNNKELFYEAKGIIETLFEKLGILKEDYRFTEINNENYKNLLEKGAEIQDEKGNFLGVIGEAKEEIKKLYDLKEKEIVFWEIEIEPLKELSIKEIEFKPLPLYPAIIRDISFLVKTNILVDNILSAIQKSGVQYLEDVDLFDVYEKDNEKSLSFHLVFRSSEKTLTSEEVDREMEKIFEALKKIGAKIR